MHTTWRSSFEALIVAFGLLACSPGVAPAQGGGKTAEKAAAKDQTAPVTVMAIGNKLVVTSDDREALAVVSDIVRQLLSRGKPGDFEVIRLKFANAVETANILDEIFNGPKTQGGGKGNAGGGFGGQGGFGGAGGLFGMMAGGSTREDRIRIVADPATNALIVNASQLDMLTIRGLLAKQLDAGVTDADAIIRTHVIGPLKSAHAVDVVAVIREVYRESMNNNARGLGQINNPFTGVTAAPTYNIDANGNPKGVALTLGLDDKTNSLYVACPAPMFKEIKALVDRMEAAATNNKQTVKIVKVPGVDPALIQQALDAIQGRSTAQRGNGADGQAGNRAGNYGNMNPGGMFGNTGPGGGPGVGGIMPAAGAFNNPTFTPGLGGIGGGGKGPQ